ncbi:MAG: RNA polymerase sigma-70 factor [Saprospiraceae bacterium]|nr:RNA polymerase sigma-70 factor [Saprospiraceae bacterium]
MEQPNTQTQIAALRNGDESAFDAVFRRWYEPLCQYACRMTDSDIDEAEDIVQQVFVKIWEQRERLAIEWSLKAYLYKTVHNAALNRIRASQTRSKYLDFNAAQLDNKQALPDDHASELGEHLQKALDLLPPQCRHIFELSRFEELKYREIADHLGISIKTVETQMGKALRILRLQLADYLVTLFGFWCVVGAFI